MKDVTNDSDKIGDTRSIDPFEMETILKEEAQVLTWQVNQQMAYVVISRTSVA
jgi:hypothetical protein